VGRGEGARERALGKSEPTYKPPRRRKLRAATKPLIALPRGEPTVLDGPALCRLHHVAFALAHSAKGYVNESKCHDDEKDGRNRYGFDPSERGL
jgi:hypothetical protein